MKTIVNLTLAAVAREIEEVLETYPHHPYQKAFSIPDLRQELTAHVLSQISNCYVVVDHTQKLFITLNSLPCSLDEKECIKDLIHREIENVWHKKEKELSHQIPEELDPGFAPSHWFG
ncbi:hypothetical protein [Scytonema sp. UIC 10036]|uniref:hypothetical protein n=1 Tax=Scytonema sp. UIC 10036 TaxID=2304196 RepID=UPI0012DAE3DE|nr:hypothetical protein [Scytonema sp. UIC 10036]